MLDPPLKLLGGGLPLPPPTSSYAYVIEIEGKGGWIIGGAKGMLASLSNYLGGLPPPPRPPLPMPMKPDLRSSNIMAPTFSTDYTCLTVSSCFNRLGLKIKCRTHLTCKYVIETIKLQ